nr:coronatine-insensitive protein 1 [Ginkgo biloba]|eukprot:Gb_04106 [translate_table: standard]
MGSYRLVRGMSDDISEEALELVMNYIDDPRDRSVVSQVCRKWYRIDALTRNHVTVAFCYTINPSDLTRRFKRLESLKLKGKPRASMFNLIQEDWGGYAQPWIHEISNSSPCLKSLHLRRMIVTDDDLATLVKSHGHMLQAVKLDKCSGFSTLGLLEIARACRSLKFFLLEESSIEDEGGEWLHELALWNSSLEVLNFYLTGLESIKFNLSDLELLATNCRSLTSLRVNECDILDLRGVLEKATELEEFGGGSFSNSDEHAAEVNKDQMIRFPSKLTSLLGLNYMSEAELPAILPRASNLKKLDLQFTFLSTENHCQLIRLCTNLEVLEVRSVIGDRGLEVVANHCKKLRRLRVEDGEEEQGLEDDHNLVSHRGLSAVAQGCPNLEFIAIYVSDISNSALETVGEFCKNLRDFRLVLLNKERVTDLPLDNGVMALLRGCHKLNRFGLYFLRPGGLTDTGLGYIGKYSTNVRWMLLGFVGESDGGLLEFSKGCSKLERLEMRGCCFSESALAAAVQNLKSLKYIWVQGYNATAMGDKLLAMSRPFWNIEFTPAHQVAMDEFVEDMEGGEQPAQILAYYSLAGRRTDNPKSVILLSPSM